MPRKIGEYRKLPGEKSELLFAIRNEYVPKAVSQFVPIFVSRASGAIVEDVDGNEYIDFAGGISALNTGHCHPEVIAVIKEQAEKYLHTSFNVTMYESYVRLAKKLVEITPGSFPKQVLLTNSGAEAVENAIKVARKYTGKRGIIAFEYAFHGRTWLTMGLSGSVKSKSGFGPFDPSIQRFPYAYTYRAPFPTTDAEYGKYCVKLIEDGFKTHISADETAAIIVEPFLGEGGCIAPPPEFIKGLRRLCDQHELLLIVDEIQSGLGRTGKMWGVDHFSVIPDILVAGKSLSGGLVLSATIARKEIMDSVDVGGLGGTFGGNPLACVAALKVLEILKEENLLEQTTRLGKIAKSRLEEMKSRYNLIGDVRGLGCAIGVELVKDRRTKEPASQETKEVMKKCHEHGLILISCGVLHNIIRILFPLVIRENELDTGLGILDRAIKEVNENL